MIVENVCSKCDAEYNTRHGKCPVCGYKEPHRAQEAGGSSSPATLLAGCECMHWASARLDIQVLTGHHENCPKGGNLEEAYQRLIAALVKGMENWAADEDGIHPDAWEAYKRGKCVIGQYDWKEESAS